jgi:hypothetical protein
MNNLAWTYDIDVYVSNTTANKRSTITAAARFRKLRIDYPVLSHLRNLRDSENQQTQ